MPQNNSGSAVLEVSRKVYESSLALYPEDLRNDFGEEMVAVFEEQISGAYQQQGVTGLLRVWWYATREFVGIALTGQVAQRMIPVVAAVTALALMMWLGGFMVTPVVFDKACGH